MEEIDLREFTLRLSRVPGIGPKTFQLLIERYGNVSDIYSNLDKIKLKNLSVLDSIKINDTLISRDINYVCVWEDTYPLNLKQVSDPPIVLFYKGNLDQKIDRSFSIVGTRDITSYGKKYAAKFAADLTDRGYSIISGMAFGVDRAAHESCLNSRGYTVAVLASSVDEPSPQNNSDIYQRILDNDGLILSETAPGEEIGPGNFPNRNRIIAGLGLGTIVVEAAEKSGSLITADLALGYGRDVFAIPGNLDNIESQGTNSLIRDSKAKLVKNIDDILIEYGVLAIVDENHNLENKNLSLQEKEIYNSILTEAKLVEEIAKLTKKDIQEVISLCSILELKGAIAKHESGKFYIS